LVRLAPGDRRGELIKSLKTERNEDDKLDRLMEMIKRLEPAS
jgi:hypothetical protein